MSEKQLRMAIGFLIVVLVLWAGAAFLNRGQASTSPDSGLARTLDAIGDSDASRVHISGPSDTIELRRSGDDWTANGYPSDTAAVGRLWRALPDTRVGSVVAANPSNHSRLGVAADSTWRMEVGEDGQWVILIGNTGGQFQTAFARLPDQDEVHRIRGDLRGAVARSLLDWRDKTIVSVDTSRIQTIHLRRADSEAILERADSGWSVAGEPADGTKVRSLLQELTNLRATGFAPDTAVLGEDGRREVAVLDASGHPLASLDLAEHEGDVRVQAEGVTTVFELSNFRADRITPFPDSMRADGG